MKYGTAAAIAICIANGAVAAPTQASHHGLRTHKPSHGQKYPPGKNYQGSPPQLPGGKPKRRDLGLDTAELSDMIFNALAEVGREPLQRRGDIGEGAAKALAQTARFTQGDSRADIKPMSGGIPSRRSLTMKPQGGPVAVHAREEPQGENGQGGDMADEKKLEKKLKDKKVINAKGKLNFDKLFEFLGSKKFQGSKTGLSDKEKEKVKQTLKMEQVTDSKGKVNLSKILQSLKQSKLGGQLDSLFKGKGKDQ